MGKQFNGRRGCAEILEVLTRLLDFQKRNETNRDDVLTTYDDVLTTYDDVLTGVIRKYITMAHPGPSSTLPNRGGCSEGICT